jgi:hypothetical protein
MKGSCPRILAALLAVLSCSSAASAATIQIGLFSYDANTSAGDTFNIFNLTGDLIDDPAFPVETQLAFTVSSFLATLNGGGTLTLGSSAFADDGLGNVNCTATGFPTTGGCNFAAFDVTSVTISGTLSPTFGLLGLPAGFVGIESTFQAILTAAPGVFLTPGDAVIIEAMLVPSTPPTSVPEPSTMMLLQLGMGALGGYRYRRQIPFLRRAQVSR